MSPGINRRYHIIFSVDNKMPGYPKTEMMTANPEPTPETDTIVKRFKLPALPSVTLVQFVLLALLALYGFSVRKMKRPVLLTIVAAIGALHAYDHIYRVKRGPERTLFGAEKEEYCCGCK